MNLSLIKPLTNRGLIGVDVGSWGLRLVQLKRGPHGLEISSVAAWERGTSEVDAMQDGHDAERMTSFLQQVHFAGHRAVAALAPPAIELHPLDIPTSSERLSPEQLNKAAKWEIQRLSTLRDCELQTASWAVPESKRSKANMMGVAAVTDQVLTLIKLCDNAGLECVQVDAAPCALASLSWHLRGQTRNDVWGVLDIGYALSRLIICVHDAPVLVRTFEGSGGGRWTERIARELGLGLSVAERHKREVGIASAPAEPGPVTAEEYPQPAGSGDAQHSRSEMAALIHRVLKDDLKRLALECERSFEYVLQCYPKLIPGDLVLLGGGALLSGLDDYLGRQLGIQVMPVSRCSAAAAGRLSEGLGTATRLEICALAAALSFHGLCGHA